MKFFLLLLIVTEDPDESSKLSNNQCHQNYEPVSLTLLLNINDLCELTVWKQAAIEF